MLRLLGSNGVAAMGMNRQQKLEVTDAISERLARAAAVITTEYRGLSVEELTTLRRELRANGAEFKVAKNRLAKRSLQGAQESFSSLGEELQGPTGLVFAYEDAAAAAKLVLEFQKTHDKLVVKSGVMDGKKVSPSELKAIADLPSKEVLLAQIVGSLLSPHRGLVTTISGVARNLVQVINAIKDKKQA